ncbi:hypothetical protein BH24ACT5_BH24ACT5_03740 [soil metagenome]
MAILKRTLIITTMLALLSSAVPAHVFGWAFPCGGVGARVCNWLDSGWKNSQAGRDGSDSTYVGDKYPNTNINVDNSASSLANYYGSSDVTWHWEPNNQGIGLCADSGWGYTSLGLNNDMFSSHAVSGGGTC